MAAGVEETETAAAAMACTMLLAWRGGLAMVEPPPSADRVTDLSQEKKGSRQRPDQDRQKSGTSNTQCSRCRGDGRFTS